MVFSDKLKALRTSKNITQNQLASRLGITRAAVSAYETGVRTPSYDVLVKIATLFNVTIDSLLGVNRKDLLNVSGLDTDQRNIVQGLVENLLELNRLKKS